MRTSFATPPLWCPGRFQYDLAKVKGAKGDPAQTSPGPRVDPVRTQPGPGPDPAWTRSRPSLDPVQTQGADRTPCARRANSWPHTI